MQNYIEIPPRDDSQVILKLIKIHFRYLKRLHTHTLRKGFLKEILRSKGRVYGQHNIRYWNEIIESVLTKGVK